MRDTRFACGMRKGSNRLRGRFARDAVARLCAFSLPSARCAGIQTLARRQPTGGDHGTADWAERAAFLCTHVPRGETETSRTFPAGMHAELSVRIPARRSSRHHPRVFEPLGALD